MKVGLKMTNVSRDLIKQSIRLSLTLWVYLIPLSDVGVAESSYKNVPKLQQSETISQNDETATEAQQLFNEAEKLAKQRTIPSQLQAIQKWSEAGLKWQRLGDKPQEALTLIKLGETYKNLGATTPALEHYTQALTLYRELNNRLQEAFTLSEIGSIYIIELEQLEKEQRFSSIHGLSVNSRLYKTWLNKTASTPEKAK